MDRLAVPVAFVIVLALVAVLLGTPLVPRFTVPGAASLGAVVGAVPDALDGILTPRTAQGTDLVSLLATHGAGSQASLPPGLVERWAGAMEVYVPAPLYLADYPVLPGPEKAAVTVEVDHPAPATKPDGLGGGSSGGAVEYGGD